MLLGRLRGEQVAREVELQIEWAPEPPFGTGRPDLAGPELVKQALRSTAPGTELFRQVGVRAARRLGITVPSPA